MILEMLSLSEAKDVTSTKLYSGDGSVPQSVDMNVDLSSGKGFAIVGSRTNVAIQPFSAVGPFGSVNSGNVLKGESSVQTTISGTVDGFSTSTFRTIGDDFVAVAVSYGNNNVKPCDWGFSSVVNPSFVPGSTQTITHNLGSVPEAIWIWSYLDDGSGPKSWHHRWHSGTGYVYLDGYNQPSGTSSPPPGSAQPFNLTSTTFDVSGELTQDGVSGNLSQYFAIVYGDGNYVYCGGFTGNATVPIGWQPKVVIFYRDALANEMYNYIDVRDALGDNSSDLSTVWSPNTSDTFRTDDKITPNSTGFVSANLTSSQIYKYIAIR